MNINEQMNQLGQIGGVEYSPTAEVVDQLVGRSRRSRAFRQGTAALVGSVGAIGLGLLGAQVFVGLTQDGSDAGTIADKNFDVNDMAWEDRYGDGYTGMGKTQDELAKAWDDLQAAADAKAEEPAPAEEPKEEKPVKPTKPASEIPDGYFLFGNGEVYKCELWTDTATGTTFWGAWSGSGDWAYKMIQCKPGDKYWYSYKYMGSSATISGHTCTGASVSYLGAPHQISCRTTSALWEIYPEWNGANGGNIKWSLNNDDGKILTNSNYKWFIGGVEGATQASNSMPFFRVPSCHEAPIDGWYFTTSQHPTKDGDRYSWNGGQWVIDNLPEPTPTPTPTETTPPPEPTPTPTPTPTESPEE